jgi:GNAT superfamily N-acetyltransferase
MPRWKIDIEDKPKAEDMRFVIGQLMDFNDAHSPTAFGRRELRLFVRDDAGDIQAGLFGTVTMHCLVIQILWIAENVRGQGLGTELVETAERIAKEEGAKQSLVETTTFQAPEFYHKLGYRVICEIEDCPIDSQSLLMRKWFV